MGGHQAQTTSGAQTERKYTGHVARIMNPKGMQSREFARAYQTMESAKMSMTDDQLRIFEQQSQKMAQTRAQFKQEMAKTLETKKGFDL